MFPGIHPHLNSLLQTPGSVDQPALWGSFHAAHINHIADLLNEHLPAHYTAYSEQSLQIYDLEWETGASTRRPDVSIYRSKHESSGDAALALPEPTWESAITLEPLKHPYAVVIRESQLGRIVSRIELISPWNKTDRAYQYNRVQAIQSGVPLIEIDYLHETPPIIPDLPRYPDEADATPYYIAVTDPRPSWDQGIVRVYGFDVQDGIPAIPIPLDEDETLIFKLSEAYQRTFISRRYANLIDLSQLPVRFETYRTDAQAYIRQSLVR